MSLNPKRALDILTAQQTEAGARRLANDGRPPDLAICAASLAHHAPRSKFSVRYVEPGESAKVFLLVPDEGFPRILKVSSIEAINREILNYRWVRKLPPMIKPARPARGPEIDGFSSIVYEWSAGWSALDTLSDALSRDRAPSSRIASAIESLMASMWEWYSVRKSSALPEFDWRGKQEAILQRLNLKRGSRPSVEELEAVVRQEGLTGLELRRSCKASITHGDLNAKNVLITRGSLVQPFLIDFQDLTPHICPARDWAKLERDLKFKSLRKAQLVKPETFGAALMAINAMAAGNTLRGQANITTKRYGRVIRRIRRKYCQFAKSSGSEIAEIEYLYYLLCWELEYLCKPEYSSAEPHFQNAIMDSATYTRGLLTARSTSKPSPVSITDSALPLRLEQDDHTHLRAGRTRIGTRTLEGSMLHKFSRPFPHGKLIGTLTPQYDLQDDAVTLRVFLEFAEERKQSQLKAPFNGRCYRVVGEPSENEGVTSLPVAEVSYAHYIASRTAKRDVLSSIREKLDRLSYEGASIIHPRHVTPLGIEVAVTTKGRHPKLLAVHKSVHTLVSAGQWDVTFSGYVNTRDLNEDRHYIDFWSSAQREACAELNEYYIECRNLTFSGIHLNLETGAIDLLGHYTSQEDEKGWRLYLKAFGVETPLAPIEPEVEGASFHWIEASPSGIASFCKQRGVILGGHSKRGQVFISEAAHCIIHALQNLGYSEAKILRELEPVCQAN